MQKSNSKKTLSEVISCFVAKTKLLSTMHIVFSWQSS